MIQVRRIDARSFEVSVSGRTGTTHAVGLNPDYHQELTAGRISAEELIRKSFEFLLERESNTSILRAFELPVIGQYFPEYEATIRAAVGESES